MVLPPKGDQSTAGGRERVGWCAGARLLVEFAVVAGLLLVWAVVRGVAWGGEPWRTNER
jgi:hypothetical protein